MKYLITLLFSLSTLLMSPYLPAESLNNIIKRGYITVGTTGDYTPFSHYDGQHFSGYDIDVAHYFGDQLGVEVKFVQTSWKNLIQGLDDNQYDIAMGGITRRTSRQLLAEQSQPYMTIGKCFLVKKGTGDDFNTLKKVNRPTVKVGVNIGGTNEKFADKFLSKATLVRFDNNLDVPKALENGDIDVMVTETPEALYYQVTNQKLAAVRSNQPFTKSQFGYLIKKGNQRLLNTVNFMMDDMNLKDINVRFLKNNKLTQ